MTNIDLPPISPQTMEGDLHPQEKALLSTADIIGYGGEAGSGKSYVAVLFAGRWHFVEGYGALISRRDTEQLTGPGSLWETGRRIYQAMGAETIESPHNATWANGASVIFRHMQYEQDVEKHDGKEYGAVVLDEAQMYTEKMIWYLWGRCRTPCGVTPQMLLPMNPDPDCYCRVLFDWWIGKDGFPIPERDGVLRWCLKLGDDTLRWFEDEQEGIDYCNTLRKNATTDADKVAYEHIAPTSITFIRGRLRDNKALLSKDPTYGARIAMLDVVSRSKKQGNWNARATSGSLFSRAWFNVLYVLPEDKDVLLWVRGWDKAGSAPSEKSKDPDWTVGTLLAYLRNGNLVFCDVVRDRLEPGGVEKLQADTARTDGPKVVQAIWQDPAQAGKVDIMHTQTVMRKALPSVMIEVEVEKESKLVYASLLSGAVDPRSRNNMIVAAVVDGPWVQPWFAELEAFPDKKSKKDQVDSASRAYLEIHKLKEGFAGDFLRAMRKIRV